MKLINLLEIKIVNPNSLKEFVQNNFDEIKSKAIHEDWESIRDEFTKDNIYDKKEDLEYFKINDRIPGIEYVVLNPKGDDRIYIFDDRDDAYIAYQKLFIIEDAKIYKYKIKNKDLYMIYV